MKTIYYLFFSVLITLTACHKQQVYHSVISQNMLAHYNYQKGSYWVYRDSLTGTEDSFYVARHDSLSIVSIDDYTKKEISDYVNIYLRHACTHPVYLTDTMPIDIYLGQGITIKFGSLMTNLYDPFTVGAVSAGNGFLAVITNFYPAYLVKGVTFPNVYEINDTTNHYYASDYDKYNDWHFLSDSVGLIKIVLNHNLADTINKVWELERWKIVK